MIELKATRVKLAEMIHGLAQVIDHAENGHYALSERTMAELNRKHTRLNVYYKEAWLESRELAKKAS